MTLQLASDIALTAEIIDAATGLVTCSANDLMGSNIIDADYTVIETAPLLSAPAKKVYDTPYLPRGQFFKKLREEGKLAARQPNQVRAARPAKVEKAVEAKPARTRSPQELAAIRRHFARQAA
jgi:hypothetical protein